MSFGRPPSFTTFSANPPDRGSFPLDHDGRMGCTVLLWIIPSYERYLRGIHCSCLFSSLTDERELFSFTPIEHTNPGECSKFMKEYLACLKENQNNNGKCRLLSKDYLNCRMQQYVSRIAKRSYGIVVSKIV